MLLKILMKVYSKKDNNEKIYIFISQTNIILNDYLSSNDRLSVFIYDKQYHIICPLLYKNKVDINNIYNDLMKHNASNLIQ